MPLSPAVLPLVRQWVQLLRQRPVRITVVGDIILDNAIEGTPGGTHPEFKIPLLKEACTSESIGGAANIALALARLGVQTTVFSVVGNDLPGRQVENLLDRHPFSNYIVRQRGWPTPRKDWIYAKEPAQVRLTQRIDYDRPLPAAGREELLGEFRARAPDAIDVLILADHGGGTLGPELMPLLKLAKEKGAKGVAIPRSDVLRGQPLDAIVLNEAEMRRLAGGTATADAKSLAQQYCRDYRQHIFLTLFEEGMAIYSAGGGDPHSYPVLPLKQHDWMGVRDITTVIVAIGLALGRPLEEIGQVAMVFRYQIASVRGNGRAFWRDVATLAGSDDPTEFEME